MNNKDLQPLHPDDAKAVDALVEHQFDPETVPSESAQRATAICELLANLDHLPNETGADLVAERTLAAVAAARPIAAEAAGAERGLGMGLREMVAMVALLLISGSLLWPLLKMPGPQAQRQLCEANLAKAWEGLANYSTEYDGYLPATKAVAGDVWARTAEFKADGSALSNSAHLFTAVRTGHVSIEDLRCAANQRAQTTWAKEDRDWTGDHGRSFSYQNQFGTTGARLDKGKAVAILADKNPNFQNATYNPELDRTANSPNHRGDGQNVLLSNGSVRWLDTPVIDQDNIYHAGLAGRTSYLLNELPESPTDSFLVP